MRRGKAKGGSTRQPHRGVLRRTASQSSLSSEDSEEARKSPSWDEKKIAVSMERLKEMEQREQLHLAKIEELTTRLVIRSVSLTTEAWIIPISIPKHESKNIGVFSAM